MINNRQGGRRRGRGGQRPPNIGGGRPDGNRQDNRQRGNAAQLLEKYKSMARDSQLAGDRVQTEYYLQFADHYFRVLSESRARFEDQRRQRGDDSDEDDGDEEMLDAGDDSQGADARDEDQRPERRPRPERSESRDRPERNENRPDRSENRPRRYARDEREDSSDRMNGGGRHSGNGESIPFDVLPPAIGRDEPANEAAADEENPRPRRRTRRPRAAEDGDVTPAV